MAAPQHVRIINPPVEPYDWMDEGPYSAVAGDRAPALWGALNALLFVIAVVVFAIGLGLAGTAPAGRPDIGLAGVVLVALSALAGAFSWGLTHEEQKR